MGDTHAAEPGLTVLVVDDEEDLREVIRRILERRGMTALVAADPAEAVSLSREYPGDIHVLLTDLSMPGMRGQDLAHQVAALRPGVRVVYVSGTSRDLAVEHGMIEEDARMVEKPFTTESLTAAVRAAVARSTA